MQPGGEPWLALSTPTQYTHMHKHARTRARARTFIIEVGAVIIIKRRWAALRAVEGRVPQNPMWRIYQY